ncbi:MAG: hypothetical protein K1X89_26920 [Myxococcaceae bacterium]|nr:hypothetical protein [Myxococcaceae bacterium]
MAYFRDLGTSTQIAEGAFVRAVGWLAKGHDFPTGPVPEEFRERLKAFSLGWGQSVEALGWPVAAGPHACEFCSASHASGNFGVPAGALLYVCPEMLGHYVDSHRYRPPDAFVSAVLASPVPGTAEYAEAVRPFRPRDWRRDR